MAKRIEPEPLTPLSAPFPWFGGKSRAGTEIWSALGEVTNYVEPFCGSLAALLTAPRIHHTETVNDADGFVANFWRATSMDPEAVAHFADWPVNEADLEARHAWLVARSERLRWCLQDPDFYDAKMAGWWVWGQCSWIGTGWCSGEGPHKHNGANFTGNAGRGINRKLPHLGDAGRGINRQLPHLGNAGQGITNYISALSARLRRTRVACGDWGRVVTPVCTWRHGLTGVFLDPPYGEGTVNYRAGGNTTDVASKVWAWALENGAHPKMRIVVAAYEDGRDVPTSWTVRPWRARKGYKADGGANARREVLYCSPGCVSVATKDQLDLTGE